MVQKNYRTGFLTQISDQPVETRLSYSPFRFSAVDFTGELGSTWRENVGLLFLTQQEQARSQSLFYLIEGAGTANI